tara:strand:- start:94 stop:822 length:729 start_codon:yes stop_codon:yes gene_type:complete
VIDIENSSVYLLGETNCWRANVKSVLFSKDKSFILTKECRSETISSSNPFEIDDRNEVIALIENDQVYILRSNSISSNSKYETTREDKIKAFKYLPEKNFNALEFKQAHNLISSREVKNIICKLDYKLDDESYSLISKCEYINFNIQSSSNKYLQPIIGYVPFILNAEKKVAYVACNLNEEKNSDIFFIVRDRTPIFNIKKNSFFKNFIKKILNSCFFFLKKKEFTKVIQIKEYKMSLFENS